MFQKQKKKEIIAIVIIIKYETKNVWRGGHWSAAKYVQVVNVLQPAAAEAAEAAAVSPQLLHFNFLEKAAA